MPQRQLWIAVGATTGISIGTVLLAMIGLPASVIHQLNPKLVHHFLVLAQGAQEFSIGARSSDVPFRAEEAAFVESYFISASFLALFVMLIFAAGYLRDKHSRRNIVGPQQWVIGIVALMPLLTVYLSSIDLPSALRTSATRLEFQILCVKSVLIITIALLVSVMVSVLLYARMDHTQ